jgi:PPK2 family polyphosphate:nucleotide phosphotransferase
VRASRRHPRRAARAVPLVLALHCELTYTSIEALEDRLARKTAALADFRHSTALTGRSAARRGRFDLGRFDPGSKPFSSGSKVRDKNRVEALAVELDQLQDLFYADRRYKLLVVLQGTDTSGKDGTIRGVFGRMSALGVHTIGWKAPTEPERARDYLWRIHAQVPAQGQIVIFNRSHYEDVLVPAVNGWITPQQTRQRYAHINEFERMLTETGTTVLKFFLHISKQEQRVRLQERLDDPDKHWKFAAGDLQVRKQWDDYQQAYSDAIAATGTPWAPWTIVPADSKTHRNLMISLLVKQTLTVLKLRYPPGDPGLADLRIE